MRRLPHNFLLNSGQQVLREALEYGTPEFVRGKPLRILEEKYTFQLEKRPYMQGFSYFLSSRMREISSSRFTLGIDHFPFHFSSL